MIYCLLSSISLEAISIALFLVLALGFLFFVCISRNSKATEFVQVNKQRTGRSKRVLSILFAILSLSLILGSSIAVSSVQPTNVAVTYSLSDNVNLSNYREKNDEEPVIRQLLLNNIRNAKDNKRIKFDGYQIEEAEFQYYESMRADNYYGIIVFVLKQSDESDPINVIRAVHKHVKSETATEEKDKTTTYYYVLPGTTASNGESSDTFDNRFVIEDYNIGWTQEQWYDVFKEFLDNNIVAIMITLLVAAAFWAIILGINMAKAPDSATAGKFKTRLWQLFIGLFVLIAVIFFLYWILGNISSMMDKGSAIYDTWEEFGNSNFKSFLDKIK